MRNLRVGDRVNVATRIEGMKPGRAYRDMKNAIVKDVYDNGSAWITSDKDTIHNGLFGGILYFASYEVTKIE